MNAAPEASARSLIGLTLFMAALVAALTLWAYAKEPRLAWQGWKQGGHLLLRIFPMLVLAFALSGLAQVLVPKEAIARWLGQESGWRGIWLGCLAGALTPGGPYTSFPLVAGLYHAGAGIGTVVAYITAWSLWALARIPLEVALINPRFAVIRLTCTVFMPPLAGFLAHVVFGRFARG